MDGIISNMFARSLGMGNYYSATDVGGTPIFLYPESDYGQKAKLRWEVF